MATLRGAVKTLLTGDGALSALLTGGVYDRAGISRTLTPAVFDSVTGSIKPCAVVTEQAATPMGHREFDMERSELIVWLYQDEGGAYAVIDPAKARVRTLLHNQQVTTDTGDTHTIEWAYSLGDAFDDVLSAEMTHERFTVWRTRT